MTTRNPRRAISVFLALFAFQLSAAPPALDDYLPAGVDYDPAIPTPSSVLGFEVGEWHVRHDQLVSYSRAVAAASDRVRLEETGRSHEARPLLLAVVSAPANLARLDALLDEHRRLSDPAVEAPDTADMPIVVNLGYSVHGNEASGSNAALLTLYHLAAARGPEIDRLLDEAIVLIDPSLNPDGMARFAQWANMHRGKVPVADPEHREHREAWPSGRTNHYWFDLNRDWLPAQHPESAARLAQFHRFRPNLLTDFHEMESGGTYFFQPGVPVRQNPLTPERNLDLTRDIARYHARALDRRGGRLYYSEERFDDFYYGKGSTYPDVQGTIGILFEQASVRGHVQKTANGELTFPFAIDNHFTTTLSSLEAALDKRRELLDYQADFYRRAAEQALDDPRAAWVFGDGTDPARGHHLLEVLLRHRIEVHELGAPVEAGGRRFEPGAAYLVPVRQAQYLLLRALFETATEFADSTFYDVSTWTLPLAFGLPHAALADRELQRGMLGSRVERAAMPAGSFPESGDAYAYLFAWDGYYAPRALYRLLRAGVRARVATQPFTAATSGGERAFARGTILVPMGIQDDPERAVELLREAAARDALTVHAAESGLTAEGVDLGSPSLRPLEVPKPALLVGRGVETYPAGEAWHLLDHRFEIELPLIDTARLGRVDLEDYSHLLLVDGRYRSLGPKAARKIVRWVRGGGVLVASQDAIPWIDRQLATTAEDGAAGPDGRGHGAHGEPSEAQPPADDDDETPERRPWAEREKDRAEQLISGSIFALELDLTHPLAYGYRRPELPVFRNHELFLEPESDPYATVAVYAEEPLLSGYVSAERLDRLRSTPAITARPEGRGVVVRIADDLNFRAFWYGTSKLFLNPLFFGSLIEAPPER